MSRLIRFSALFSVVLAGSLLARADRHHTSTSYGDAFDCSAINVNFDDEETARSEQELTIPAGQVSQLQVDHRYGGISVRGSDRGDYHIRACKAAAGSSETDAQQKLQQISVSVTGGRVNVSGPARDGEGSEWSVYLLIEAPRAASLDLRTTNGPISLRQLSGKIVANTTNGPIAVRDCSGDVEASAHNGPISLHGSSGKIHAQTQNGPISVALSGNNWQGEGLDARAENGPVSVAVPEDYRSGVIVQTDGHSPMSCRASVCSNARKTWDEGYRRIELGSGNPQVRVSTVNGPASVNSSHEMD